MSLEVSVIGLAETNTNPDNKSLYELDNYHSIYQKCIEGKRKGSGVALYIRKCYNFSKFSDMYTTSTDFESIFVEINPNRGNSVIVGVIYRPSSGKIENFNDQPESIPSQIPENTRAYIMGDYNIDMFKDNRITSAFEESFISHGFFPSISIATHVKPNCRISCLDNILTNNPDLVLSSCTINSDITSPVNYFNNPTTMFT